MFGSFRKKPYICNGIGVCLYVGTAYGYKTTPNMIN